MKSDLAQVACPRESPHSDWRCGGVIILAGALLAAPLMTPPLQSVAHAQQPDARALGCIADNKNADPLGIRDRDLDGSVFKDPAMTATKCLSLCRAQGFRYAGLQDGSWCFCGNSYGRYKNGAANCKTPCAGDATQTCGGEWANSVWELSVPQPASTPPEPSDGPQVEEPDLATSLQEALNNIDCYTLNVDGIWGPGSKAAVRRFNAMSGMNLPLDLPTQEALEAVTSWGGGNCPQVAKRKAPQTRAKKSRSKSTTKKSTSTKKKSSPGGGSIGVIIRGPGGLGIQF